MKFGKTFLSEIVIIFIFGIFGGYLGSHTANVRFSKSLNLEQLLSSHHSPVVEQKKIIIQENKSLVQAIEKVEADIVPIFQDKYDKKEIVGNSFSLTSDGLIVTLSTCLPNNNLSHLFIGKKTIRFQVIKRDLIHNLALVKIEGDQLQTSGFAREDDIKLGEKIFVLGLTSSPIHSVTSSLNYMANEGIISQIGKDYYLTDISPKSNIDGSPCFNDKGDFVGLAEISKHNDLLIIPASVIKDFAGL